MLTVRQFTSSPSDKTRTRCTVRDITKEEAIPRGEVVQVHDYDTPSVDEVVFFVEWRNRIYVARDDELSPA